MHFYVSGMVQGKNESLFHYTTGKDFYVINNRTIQPHHFVSDGVGLASYLNTSCSANIRQQDIIDSCKNNTACVVDYALTCNKTFGLRTLQTQTNTAENIAILGKTIQIYQKSEGVIEKSILRILV